MKRSNVVLVMGILFSLFIVGCQSNEEEFVKPPSVDNDEIPNTAMSSGLEEEWNLPSESWLYNIESTYSHYLSQLSEADKDEFLSSIRTYDDGKPATFIVDELESTLSSNDFASFMTDFICGGCNLGYVDASDHAVLITPSGITASGNGGGVVYEDKKNYRKPGCKPKVRWVCVIKGPIIIGGGYADMISVSSDGSYSIF